MIKFLHAADFHLDAAFSSLTGAQAALRRREQRELLDELAELCRDRDLVLLSGDLFDGAHVYRDTLDALKRFFAAVSGEIFIAAGNHDALVSGSPYLTEDWGENVHIFTDESPQCIRAEKLGCNVYGAAFHGQTCPPPLVGFRVDDPSALNVMVLHGDLQPASPYAPVTPEQIAASGLDYLALGHIHTARSARFGTTLAAYSGCLMGRGFDECGKKGVLLGTLEKNAVTAEFVPVESRCYEILTVEAGDDPTESVLAALPPEHRRDCYRIIFTGESDGLDLSLLQKRLEGEFFSLSLRDRTVPRAALWQEVGADTLRGYALQALRREYDAAEEEQKPTVALAARLLRDLMDGREVAL